MSAYADLIERLRHKHCCNANMARGSETGCNCDECADAISRLEREKAELQEAAAVVIAANDQLMKAGVFKTDYANALDRLAALSRTQEPPR